ncbi:hypothetical protein [Dyella sp. EPa41]|uniref:hypothetical protein n=1 Tax=Dyella sp. EPa41 TaxID=1561194 RepID=UPI001915CEA9|nr:hypothetical protein [Dyella sp. EPa41]
MLKHLVAVIALLGLPCLSVQADTATQPIEREDAAVLRASLSSQCQAKDGYVLLSSTTVTPRENDDMGEADESGAFADLKRRNGSTVSLPESLACKGARQHREQEIRRFFDEDSMSTGKVSLDEAWKKLFEAFPGATGWTSISLPGYSTDGDIAVVYIARHCGSLCGQGIYVYLRRVNNQWKVLVRFPVWVS